ncbi:MAG: glycosyltransferase [Candidatus Pacebacteria bacterium]|nr:glycosyltransferase [Candidatus Paceibacterota bacterium]
MHHSKRKKMLFIAPSPMYVEKGSSLRMFAILKILATEYDIDLVTYSTGNPFQLEHVTVHRTPRFFQPDLAIGKISIAKLIFDFLMYLKIVWLSMRHTYDVVHCEDFEGVALGYFSAWFNKRSAFVYDLHNRILDNLHLKTKPNKILDTILLFLERRFVNKSSQIILNWKKYESDVLLTSRPSFLYYDPIDDAMMVTDIPPQPYLIYAGNFETYQGLTDFIPVFAKTKTKYALCLVGTVTHAVTACIAEHNCEDRVYVLGRKTVPETNHLIQHALCGILPRREGSCMKAIHYAMWHKAVIANDTASNREIVIDGHNGYLYDSPEALRAILENIEKNPQALEHLTDGVQQTADLIANIWDTKSFLERYIPCNADSK